MTERTDPLSTLEALIGARHDRERREQMRSAGFVDPDIYEQWFILEKIRQEQLRADLDATASSSESLDGFGELGHRVSELLDAVVVVLMDRVGSGATSERLCSVCCGHCGWVVPGHGSPPVGVSAAATAGDVEATVGAASGVDPSTTPDAPTERAS